MGIENGRLIIGIGGHAVAIEAASGTEVWRTKLKGSDFVTVQSAGGCVFAGASGELFCLDAANGEILWHNKLKRLGTGLVTFNSSSGDAAIAATEVRRRAAAAAAAGAAGATAT